MIRRMTNTSHVGMVIDNSEDEEDLIFCEQCQKQGTLSKLKERLYLDDKGKALPPPPDASDFVQCWKCGLVVPLREAKKQGKISGITGIDIIQNPYDYGKSLVLGNDARLTNRIKNLKRRRTKHPDAEIDAYLQQGWELTSYSNEVPL
jgi:hypothetical protein